ncbi:MAG: potassium-transporting ATPase subunit KdpB [Arenimonas sp.]
MKTQSIQGVKAHPVSVDAKQIRQACKAAIMKLNPVVAARSPVMFVVLLGTVISVWQLFALGVSHPQFYFTLAVAVILLATVLFANFAESIAEARGRGQAASLRSARAELIARRIVDGIEEKISASLLRKDDLVRIAANELIPADGEIIEGIASINEAAVTGESAPVLREAGTDRSGVIGGTKVLTDEILVRVSSDPGHSFLDRMIALVEGASRLKTPNELALTVLLSAMTLAFLVVVVALPFIANFVGAKVGVVTLIALLVCLIPTTIGGLLPAIGIAGMNRALQANVIAKSGKAVELAGDIDTLMLDKTGTITHGDRQATDFMPLAGVTKAQLRDAALLSSLADPTPEGKSVVALARKQGCSLADPESPHYIPFAAQTRMSGVDIGERRIRKGAGDSIERWAKEQGSQTITTELHTWIEQVARSGATPLVVAEGKHLLGVIALSDVIKHGVRERFAGLRALGVKTIMITGDNPITAAAIAATAGVDDFIAEATPEDKLKRIRDEQAQGKLVAMVGDGTNDAPALAQADIGLAMNAGTQAAKEAGNMVDLDSDPTKLLSIVEIGKQLLITRGALTTFSLANDVAKYFAIIPAVFAAQLPALSALDIMKLSSPENAVLSALIFNALIIPTLIPLALRGISFTPSSASSLLRRNLLVYGLGGVLLPFVGIKAIDLVLSAVFGA